jgi:hypothetical protein
MMLSGSGKDDPVVWNFECTGTFPGQNMNVPTTIGVPSCWQLQGFGTYNYGTSTAIAEQSNDVGLYQRSFNVPSSWAGQDVQLVFEGVMTDCTVSLNGTSTGNFMTINGVTPSPTHQGAFTQFRYDVTGLLQYGGSNTINVTVAEQSSNASVNNAEKQGDFWTFGGIYRPVYLECRPAQSIQRVAINALATGAFTANVALNSIGAANNLVGTIQTLSGQQVGSSFSVTLTPAQSTATLSTTAGGIIPWNPEAPSLYQLVLQLKQGPTLIHTITQRFGFRTVQFIAGQGFYINGVKVRMKGICKHTFWPDSGRTSSPALTGSAIVMLQAANINALRMSHYPPDQHFLDACDAAGFMVEDELTGWQHAYDNATAARICSEMVPRDVNHPCIIMWGNGNEGGWNTSIDGSFDTYDPQDRIVTHPGSGDTFNGIYDKHYPYYSDMVTSLAGATVIMPTEYQHCLYDGGGGAGLKDWLTIMEQSPVSAGGFIWSWDDEGVVRTDEGGIIDTQTNEAPDGIVGPYWQPEPSYYTVRDVFSPVTIPTAPVLSGTFDGKIGVHNDYFYTSMSTCSFVWQVVDYPLISSGASTGPIVSSSGTVAGPAIGPQASGTLQLTLPAGWNTHAALQLTAYNAAGQLLTLWTWPIQSQAGMESINLPTASGAATAVTSSTAVVLTGSTTQVAIGKTTGLISSVTSSDNLVSLTNGPRLAAGTSTFSALSVAQSGSTQVATATFTGNLQKITYTMRGDGWMKVDYIFALSGTESFIGAMFDYPSANVTGLRWLGDGPEPVWANRLQGVSQSVWSKAVNTEVPGYIWAFAPVFRGYHSNLGWATIQTTEHPINIIAETPNLSLGLLTPGNGVTPKNCVFAYPAGSISLMEAISSIGDKFTTASLGNIGPSSAPPVASGTYEGVLWMNFANQDADVQVTSVDATSFGRVTVNFSGPMSPQALAPASYAFLPSLPVYAVTQGPGNSVILDVEPLVDGASYTLSVGAITSSLGYPLDGTTSFPVSYNSALTLSLPFDTISGSVSPDTSGNGLNATLTGVTLGPGYSGNSAVFSGAAGSYATVTMPSLGSYTIAAWVKQAAAGGNSYPRIASLDADITEFFLDLTTNSIGFQAGSRGSWRSTASVLPAYGTWTHVAVTYDGTNAAATPVFYMNGTALSTLTPVSATGAYATSGAMAIGNRLTDQARGFDGSIDQFVIYNRVLTPAEIAGLAALPQTEAFTTWMSAYGLAGSNPTQSYDKDGVPDLLKYALGQNPLYSSPSPLGLNMASGNLNFTFPVATDAQGVTVNIQTATALNPTNWTTIPPTSIIPLRQLTNTTEYQATIPQDSQQHFFRLQLTSP